MGFFWRRHGDDFSCSFCLVLRLCVTLFIYRDNLDVVNISNDVFSDVIGGPAPIPAINPMALCKPGLFLSMVQQAGFSRISQSTSTYPMDFGRNKIKQVRVGTMLYKDEIDELGDDGWRRAGEAFWRNISKVRNARIDHFP